MLLKDKTYSINELKKLGITPHNTSINSEHICNNEKNTEGYTLRYLGNDNYYVISSFGYLWEPRKV